MWNIFSANVLLLRPPLCNAALVAPLQNRSAIVSLLDDAGAESLPVTFYHGWAPAGTRHFDACSVDVQEAVIKASPGDW